MTAPYTDPTNAGNKPGDGPLRAGGISVSGLTTADTDLPSTESAAVKKQKPALTLCRDLAGGNEQVKSRSTVYLPMAPGEDPTNYNNRLQRSVFYNVFGRTVEGLVGLIFAKDPKLSPDVPIQIRGEETETGETEGQWENIDLCGTHGDVFVRDLTQDALTAGHAGIFVEFPATNGQQTSGDEQRGEIRPYWIPILKDNIVSWRTTIVNGRLVLTQLVLKECAMVPDGAFGEKEQTRYRVLWNQNGVVGFNLLEVTKDKTVIEVASGLYPTQDEIPFSEIVTSGRESFLVSKPPLVDLGYLNVAHYQQWSDYATALHVSNVPILTIIGATVEENAGAVTVGPSTVLNLPVGGGAQYTSHDGAALAASKTSLDDLKADMGTLGLSMLAPQKRAAETATAKRIDEKGSDSALGVTARGVQDGVERALGFHAKYLKLPSGGSLAINRDFESNVMDPAVMSAYADLADKMGLPLRVILVELQKGGRIGQDVNLDDLEVEMLANKAARDAQKQQEAQDRLTMALGNGGKPAPEEVTA